jgi:hypothetical protein
MWTKLRMSLPHRRQAMPTFQFFKGGNKIDEVRGADINKIKQLMLANK